MAGSVLMLYHVLCSRSRSALKLSRGKKWLVATTAVHCTFYLDDADISLCTHRCILHDLEVLHQAGFARTDLRREYIIPQHDGQWVLIGMEFACVLNSVPFTPEGEPTSCGFLY